MNKTQLSSFLLFSFICATPSFTHAQEDFNLDAFDALEFNFDKMPSRTPDFTYTTPEKSTLEKLEGLASLSSMLIKKEVINPLDEVLAESPELFALTGISVYAAGSWYGITGWKKMIYTLFPYLVLRGVLKRIDQSKSA